MAGDRVARAAGHDTVHLREKGLQRLPNGDIFQKGFAEQRIVRTFDGWFLVVLGLEINQLMRVPGEASLSLARSFRFTICYRPLKWR